MKPMEIAYTVARMSGETQDRFFKTLEATGQLSAEELDSIKFIVGFLSMEINPEKKQAIMASMAEQLYNEFNAGA